MAREHLRQAIDQLDEAVKAEARALSDASKARQRLAEARDGLAIFASLQSDITVATVEALKQDVAFNYFGREPTSVEMPDRLKDMALAQQRALERVQRLADASAVLDREAEQATSAAFAAAAVADAAGARVASTEAAEALADEFEKALTLLEVIGCRMASLSETWTMLEGGRQGPVPLSPRVVDLIRHQPKPATSSPEEKQRWSLFLRGLQENPDTPIPATVLPDRPKPPTPLPVFTKPGLPWPEHQRQLAEKHAARIANLEKDRQTEVQRGLQVHRDAAKKLRDAEGKKSIAS